MSTPAGHQPTRVLPATAEQPAATTQAPPAARFWRQRLPGRIGRARTSTVVLAVLFLACSALYLGVRPDYVTVTTVDGATVRVDRSQLSTPSAPTEPAGPPATDAPETSTPVDPTAPSTSTSGTSTPGSTSPTGTEDDEDETAEPTSTRTTSSDPATTSAPETSDATEDGAESEDTAAPTG